ncbi:MAG: InlB B-repeat-containing protein [Lachnospiraceae bacterium]|nr:InlB B-repeat-containing protein [Lachnospiraceae bacterium]
MIGKYRKRIWKLFAGILTAAMLITAVPVAPSAGELTGRGNEPGSITAEESTAPEKAGEEPGSVIADESTSIGSETADEISGEDGTPVKADSRTAGNSTEDEVRAEDTSGEITETDHDTASSGNEDATAGTVAKDAAAEPDMIFEEETSGITEEESGISLPDSDELLSGYLENLIKEKTGETVSLKETGAAGTGNEAEAPNGLRKTPAANAAGISNSNRNALPGEEDSKSDQALGASVTRRSYLDGARAEIYDGLKAEIDKIAAGERSSTEIVLTDLLFQQTPTEYSAEDLGISALTEDNGEGGIKLTSEAKNAASEKLAEDLGLTDISSVIYDLLFDCPYELYWFDKTAGWTTSRNYSYGGTSAVIRVRVSKLTFRLYVREYADKTTQATTRKVNDNGTLVPVDAYLATDTEMTTAATIAVSNAAAIVTEAAEECSTDVQKLGLYRDRIRELVAYNHAAVADGYLTDPGYGNPWQLIWVFDHTPDEDKKLVVCEGFSKAFKLLCDLTEFEDENLSCWTVSGDLNSAGNGHMWNLVTWPCGCSFIVDVTNYGSNSSTYLSPYTSCSDGWYQYGLSKYRYRDTTLAHFTEEELHLADHELHGPITVSFDPNLPEEPEDPEEDPTNQTDPTGLETITVWLGHPYGEFPEPEPLGEYNFRGWYTTAEEQAVMIRITEESIVTHSEDHTLYGHWAPRHTVTYDPNGGAFEDDLAQVQYFSTGDLYEFPDDSILSREGYYFAGWYTEPSGGREISEEDEITATDDHTLYAHWTEKPAVTYDPNGGVFEDGIAHMQYFTEGDAYEFPDESLLSREDYSFTGWFTAPSGGREIEDGDEITSTESHTLYAHWADTGVVTYDPNGGEFTDGAEHKQPYEEGDVYEFPEEELLIREGYEFAGWYTAPRNGSRVYEGEEIDGVRNLILYAHWLMGDVPNEDDILEEIPEDGLWAAFTDGDGISRTADEDVIYEYTGSAIRPKVRVYDGTTLLTSGKDYTVKYSKNNKLPGTARITLAGKGNYKDQSLTKEFLIVEADLSKASAPELMTVKATGKTQTPVPSVTLYGKKLKNKKQFTVSYSDTVKDPGEYIITLTAKAGSHYTGIKTVRLLVTDAVAVKDLTVEKIPSVKYTGEEIEPLPVIRKGRTLLTQGVDYEVSYEDNVDAGTAYVIITGNGEEYYGTRRVSFKITGVSISKARLTGIPKDPVPYTGCPVNFDEELTDGTVLLYFDDPEEPLEYGTDFTASYKKNLNKGTATITLTGAGGYTGSKRVKFKIGALGLNDPSVEVSQANTSLTYHKGGASPVLIRSVPDENQNGEGSEGESEAEEGDLGVFFTDAEGRLRCLRPGTDYTMTLSGKRTAGNTITATLKGKGNFKGTYTEEELLFEVEEMPITDCLLSVSDVAYKSKAGNFYPTVKITDPNGKELKAGTDYAKKSKWTITCDGDDEDFGEGSELSYDGPVSVLPSMKLPAGSLLTLVIDGAGNYSGSTAEVKYRIYEKGLSGIEYGIAGPHYYSGKGIPVTLEPDEIEYVTADEEELELIDVITTEDIPTTDLTGDGFYLLEDTYRNNTKAGTASVMILGSGVYGGYGKLTFKILPKEFRWWDFDD